MELSTEDKILLAAKEIFTKKGFAGARMQEIADAANINKGLLHYYFRSKEKLFRAVFDKAFFTFVPKLNNIIESDLPLFDKIRTLVDQYLDILMENPSIPTFVLNELNTNPKEFVQDILNRSVRPNPMKLLLQIQLEVDAGRIRKVNPLHLMVSVLSMCVFPFVARPLFQGIVQIDDDTYMQLMEKRKQEISEFVINAIKIDQEKH